MNCLPLFLSDLSYLLNLLIEELIFLLTFFHSFFYPPSCKHCFPSSFDSTLNLFLNLSPLNLYSMTFIQWLWVILRKWSWVILSLLFLLLNQDGTVKWLRDFCYLFFPWIGLDWLNSVSLLLSFTCRSHGWATELGKDYSFSWTVREVNPQLLCLDSLAFEPVCQSGLFSRV